MRTRLLLFLAIALLAVRSAPACMWDSDTLAAEAARKSSVAAGKAPVLEAIVGRFDVYPPKYYEMRLERVTKEVIAKPAELSLYDDAGVACDRLGRGDEAIDWMARKKVELDKLPADAPGLTDQRYRYLANLGTFHAHRWVRRGADRTDLSELKQARDLIAEAIAVNPGAHFGREKYQLEALEWLIDPPLVKPREPQGNETKRVVMANELVWSGATIMIHGLKAKEGPTNHPYGEGTLARLGYEDALEGLAGLITLGGGAESVDLHHSIDLLANREGLTSLGQLASLRTKELVEAGRKSLHPQVAALSPEELIDLVYTDTPMLEASRLADVNHWYVDARRAAKEWRANRNAYLERVMAEGKHPDTHPEVMREMPDGPALPPMRDTRFRIWMEEEDGLYSLAMVAFLALGLYVALRVCLFPPKRIKKVA